MTSRVWKEFQLGLTKTFPALTLIIDPRVVDSIKAVRRDFMEPSRGEIVDLEA